MQFPTGRSVLTALVAIPLVACGSDVMTTLGVDDVPDVPTIGTMDTFLAAAVQTCHTVTFDEFDHGDDVTMVSVPLAGGFDLTVSVTPGGASSSSPAKAFDTNVDFMTPDLDLQSVAVGFVGLCVNCAPLNSFLVIPWADFDANGDSPDGGTVTLTGFPASGETIIRSYDAVDQDVSPVPETISLEVDGVQTAISGSAGDASVESVVTTSEPPITSDAAFVYSGSGAVDNIEICHTPPPPPPTNPGTGTIGFWKTHPDAWPVEMIEVGGVMYTKDVAIDWMDIPSRGDKSIDLFKQLVAAKLNVLIGNDPSCIQDTIDLADAWLALHGLDSDVRANSDAWQNSGSEYHGTLTDYNEGKLCAPHRDD